MTQLILIPGLASNAVMWQHQLRVLPALTDVVPATIVFPAAALLSLALV